MENFPNKRAARTLKTPIPMHGHMLTLCTDMHVWQLQKLPYDAKKKGLSKKAATGNKTQTFGKASGYKNRVVTSTKGHDPFPSLGSAVTRTNAPASHPSGELLRWTNDPRTALWEMSGRTCVYRCEVPLTSCNLQITVVRINLWMF